MRAPVPLASLLALAALAAPSAAQAQACDGADTAATATTLGNAREAVRCLVNAERTARGLPSVRQDDELQAAATAHTVAMIAERFFDHVAPDGATPGTRATAAGYTWSAVGENIAFGYRTPRDVVLGWMRSEGHCRNILSPAYRDLGVAVGMGTPEGSSGATWTQLFGRASGSTAPSTAQAPAEGCPYDVLVEEGAATQGGSTPPAAAPPSATPAPGPAGPARTLTTTFRLKGRALTVSGRLTNAPAGTLVRVDASARGMRLTRFGRTSSSGRFAVRLSLPAQAAGRSVKVALRAGTLRSSHTFRR